MVASCDSFERSNPFRRQLSGPLGRILLFAYRRVKSDALFGTNFQESGLESIFEHVDEVWLSLVVG